MESSNYEEWIIDLKATALHDNERIRALDERMDLLERRVSNLTKADIAERGVVLERRYFTVGQKALIEKFMEVNEINSDATVIIRGRYSFDSYSLYFGDSELGLELKGKLPEGLRLLNTYSLAELGLEDQVKKNERDKNERKNQV